MFILSAVYGYSVYKKALTFRNIITCTGPVHILQKPFGLSGFGFFFNPWMMFSSSFKPSINLYFMYTNKVLIELLELSSLECFSFTKLEINMFPF